MKKLFTILFVLSALTLNAQNKCDSGWSYMPSLSTSSLIIKADTCFPDSVCKKIMRAFAENMCGEGGALEMSNDFLYSSVHKWDDSLGCIITEIYKQKIKGKWIKISKEQYYKNSGVKVYSITGTSK